MMTHRARFFLPVLLSAATVPTRGSSPRQSVDVWVTSGLENVFRDATRPAGEHTAIRLLAARGETESAQIVVRASEGCLDSLRAEPSRLVVEGGPGLGPNAVRAD